MNKRQIRKIRQRANLIWQIKWGNSPEAKEWRAKGAAATNKKLGHVNNSVVRALEEE